jgi:hypothetical protein
MFPQALQVRTLAGSPITGAGDWNCEAGGTGAYTGEGAGSVGTMAICPARVPQTPQNFSEGKRELPHELQTDCEIG